MATMMTPTADLELALAGVPLDLSLDELLDLAVPGVPADDDFAFTLFHESDGEDSPRACSANAAADCSVMDTLEPPASPAVSDATTGDACSETVTFVEKTYYMVNTSASRLVCWNATGMGFFVLDADAFARDVLPEYFKHCSLHRFVSELTLHGFRKTVRRHKTRAIECLEFRHAHFVRGDASQLNKIERRTSTPWSPASAKSSTDILDEAMADDDEEDEHEEEGEERECIGNLKSEISDLKDEVQQTQQLFEKLIGTLAQQSAAEAAHTQTMPVHPFLMCPPHPFAMYGMAPLPPGVHPGFFHPMSFAMGTMAQPADPQATAALDDVTNPSGVDMEDDDFLAEFFPTLEYK